MPVTVVSESPILETDDLAIRRQETVFILLNVGVLAALALIHVFFQPLLHTSAKLVVVVLAARAASQLVELSLVQRHAQQHPQVLRVYSVATVWVNVAFACLVTLVSGMPDSHYLVLMVLPTIAAAFRFAWRGITTVMAVAVAWTFLSVWLQEPTAPHRADFGEYFEAATAALIYVVVALVVRLLVLQLRAESTRLQRSLTELRNTRARLLEQEKLAAVGRLSSAIAHEVRNPVAIIASAVAAAQRAGFDPAVRDEMYAIIAQESRRLERLTDDFLGYARQSAPLRQLTSAQTLLAYVADALRPRASERAVRIVMDCAPDLEILVDPSQLQRALLNLTTNALEATPAGGVVTLGLEPASDAVITLFVANRGEAISADVAARLFEPFFTTKPRGTGLGLAISRKIAQAHGGDVVLSENGPEQVRFSIRLPSADPGNR